MSREHFEQYEGQTRFKHLILRDYFEAWVQILGTSHKKLVYIDGFCGPGTYYDKGQAADGSPIIAIKIADRHRRRTEVYCIFTDTNEEFCRELDAKLKGLTPTTQYAIHAGDFDTLMNEVLDNVEALAPTFVFVDPCGWSGYPMKTIERILSRSRTEVLINFMYNAINQWIAASGAAVSFATLFGFDQAALSAFLAEIDSLSPIEREKTIRDRYIAELRHRARYVFPFKLKFPGKDRTFYYLVHATNNFKGLDVMKSVMFAAGGHSLEYAALGRNDSQLALFSDAPTLQDLKHYLQNQLHGQERSFEQIREETYQFTLFIEKHYRAALKELWSSGHVQVHQVDSKKKGALRGQDLITFPP
jgi:three-Cys-motif partner protein